MKITHADVFSHGPFTGNGLSVLIADAFPEPQRMQLIARELKQYETIFLVRTGETCFDARIFTIDEELPFAGHPILGACASLHREHFPEQAAVNLTFRLPEQDVPVSSVRKDGLTKFVCTMEQRKATLIHAVEPQDMAPYLEPLHLTADDLAAFPAEVISTGLAYLIIPVRSGLEHGGMFTHDYEALLKRIGGKFVYVIDVNTIEGRTWDNQGGLEDVATGSAAGPVAEFLIRHGICHDDADICIQQGRFLGRPSSIRVRKCHETGHFLVSGQVSLIACGEFLV